MTGPRMRVGILGTGTWAQQHAQALATLNDVQITAVSSRTLESAEAFAAQYGGQAYPDHHNLLQAPDVDAVLVAAPHQYHAPMTLEALRAGKAVLLEKPSVTSRAELEELHSYIEANTAPCLVGLTSHYLPGFVAARDLLDSGELGRPVTANSVYQKTWMDAFRKPWHLKRNNGGGMLLTVGIHALDRALWLLGGEVKDIYAVGGTSLHNMAADDLMSILLRFEGGAAAQVSSLGYVDGAPLNRTELVCERGTLRVTPETLEIGRNNAWTSVSLPEVADLTLHALAEEWLDLYHLWHSGRPARVSNAYAANLMDVLFRAEEAARTHG